MMVLLIFLLAFVPAPSFPCGADGKRVQAMYVRAESTPDYYEQAVPIIRRILADTDAIFDGSAQKTGGRRMVRWVTDEACEASVLHVVVPDGVDAAFLRTVRSVVQQGHMSGDRKYLMFMDAPASSDCALSTFIADDWPGPENWNNHGGGYAWLAWGCWRGALAAHELAHSLGAVQPSAPNSDGVWHCTDEYDLMCYPHHAEMRYICTDPGAEMLLDCNHDDYFHTSPEPGSYLATHWNVADSAFLWEPAWMVWIPGVGAP